MPDATQVAEAAAEHRCGRCLKMFALSPEQVASDWWTCDPCREVLLPGSVR
jgi:ribosomal protein L37AE/L43A